MLSTLSLTIDKITQGKTLLLAGDENLLSQLPKGNCIGGKIPYFMVENGLKVSKKKLFYSEIDTPSALESVESYTADTISSITADSASHGYLFVIIPAASDVHVSYASDAPNFADIFLKPILGWISGVHLDDLGKISPKVYNGLTGEVFDNRAVCMHFSLSSDKIANIGIINLFTQGEGDSITFSSMGFSASGCYVNGKETNLTSYIKENNIDTKLPLVANYNGANVNVGIQEIKDDKVKFYAPVFHEVEYKFANQVPDYVSSFKEALPDTAAVFSCNCILNFLYSELERKKTKGMYGPVTFGEVAYMLLNQTLVYLEMLDS